MIKIRKYIYLLLFLLISMYYTNRSIDVLKNIDPIMQEIKENNEKYKIDSVNAIIEGDKISSGSHGKNIDYKESYNKMKRYGKYNEALTVLKDTKPTISIENTYDKYLVKGNPKKRNISLIFKVFEDTNIDKILSILEENDIQATFFIDVKL